MVQGVEGELVKVSLEDVHTQDCFLSVCVCVCVQEFIFRNLTFKDFLLSQVPSPGKVLRYSKLDPDLGFTWAET